MYVTVQRILYKKEGLYTGSDGCSRALYQRKERERLTPRSADGPAGPITCSPSTSLESRSAPLNIHAFVYLYSGKLLPRNRVLTRDVGFNRLLKELLFKGRKEPSPR